MSCKRSRAGHDGEARQDEVVGLNADFRLGGANGRQLRIPLPLRAFAEPLRPPAVSLRGKDVGEAACAVLREHGGLAGIGQLARVLADATMRPLELRQLRPTLEQDPRFATYGSDLWGLRAVGMDGAAVRYTPGNGEIGQGALIASAVTEPLFYGCPAGPGQLVIVDDEDRRVPDVCGARLVSRHVLTGLRKWMQSVGFLYDGRSSIVITFVDFSNGVFRVTHQPKAEANDAMTGALGAEFAGVMRTLLQRRRGWTRIVDRLPQALYLWPGKGVGPCAPFETVLRLHNGFRVNARGEVRRSAGRTGPRPRGCDYLLHFYEPATGRVRAGIKPASPCPCGSGRSFGRCCRRARPR